MQTVSALGAYTLPALLANSVRQFANNTALSMIDSGAVTYSELKQHADLVSRKLENLGVKEGDKVALWSGSLPQWGESYFGIVNRGFVAVPLLPDFSAAEVETILQHAQVKGIIVAPKLYAKIQQLPENLLPFVINIEDGELLRGTLSDDFNPNSALADVKVEENQLASIIYTSGTTGRSKGVMLTHKNLVWNAIQCQTIQRVHQYDRALSILPLSHVYEFTIGFLMMLLCGAGVYYLGKAPTVTTLLPAMQKVRPTVMLSVPLVIEKIYKSKILPVFGKNAFMQRLHGFAPARKIIHRKAGAQLKKTFGGRLIFFGIGGSKVDPDVERFMKEAHFPYAIGYGLTETSPLLAGSNPKYTKPGWVGPILQGVELKIINPNDKGIGEVVARGPNIMQGYYNAPDLTAQTFTTDEDPCGAGWFRTGDLGIISEKYGLALKGRLKNMILGAAGENIYPEDIEFVLNQHPMVVESLVVEDDAGLVALVQIDKEKIKSALQSKNPQEVLSAVGDILGEKVQDLKEDLKYNREALLTEIKYFVNEKVNKVSKIGRVQFVESFEKTASQKIKRYMYNLKQKVGHNDSDPNAVEAARKAKPAEQEKSDSEN